MDKSILLDLVNETVRRYGNLDPDFANKMARRIKRKFSTTIDTQEIFQLVVHFKAVYVYGTSILRKYISPNPDTYADPSHVDMERFVDTLAKKFPNDDRDVLSKISGWIVYYEYLR